MSDYPDSIGFRDVVAAWAVCLAVAGGFFGYPLLTRGAANQAVEAAAAPPASLPRPPPQFCTVAKPPVAIPRG